MTSLYASVCIYWSWPKKLRKLQIIAILISVFFINFTIGSIYADGNLIPYIVSYIRARSHPKSLRNTDAIIILAVKETGATFTMLLSGWLEKQFGPRMIVLIGCSLMSSSIILSYFTIKISFWVFLITYGLMFGIGNGLAYVPPIACVVRWLPKSKGIATGITACGYGLSAVIMTGLQVLFINIHNLKPNCAPYKDRPGEKYFTQPQVLDRVPEIFLVTGGLFFIIQLVCSVFLVNPSPQEEEEEEASMIPSIKKEEEEEEESRDDANDDNKSNSNQLGSTKEALKHLLKDRNFYLLWLMFFTAGVVAAFIVGLYKAFGFEVVTDNDYFLTIVGSVGALFNSLSRIPWGFMIDFTGYKFAFIFHGSFTAIFLSTFYTASVYGGPVVYFVWMCIIFCGIGAYFAFFPVAIANSFGLQNHGMNYGILATALGAGGIVGAVIPKFTVRVIGWFGSIVLITCFQVAEVIMALFLRSSDT